MIQGIERYSTRRPCGCVGLGIKTVPDSEVQLGISTGALNNMS